MTFKFSTKVPRTKSLPTQSDHKKSINTIWVFNSDNVMYFHNIQGNTVTDKLFINFLGVGHAS